MSYFVLLLFCCRYTIDDFPTDNQFMVSMEIDVCYHYSQACTLRLEILKDVRLNKELCGDDSGYAIPSNMVHC